ncbi:NUDIX domain-containing protein [unidentified bacterial endosymbiont]|uniref:NUDIX domain-containing protein n=1 Tax=unidentified bacterial endosymbiont TaxID=2355 RepID=UPI00209D1E7B|nr:NUDIX domain-containing protein [unidentified bacterial endosymbiont]
MLSQPQPGQRETTAWELPGGKMAAGETPTTALVRKLPEALGITVSPDSLIPLTFATERCQQQQLLVPCY